MKKLVVYGRVNPPCPYCDTAKETLEKRGIPFTFVDVTQDPDGMEVLRESGLRQIPQLFLDGEHIGDSNSARTVTLDRMVIKRNGNKVPYLPERINSMAEWAKNGTNACWSSIVMKAMHDLPEGDVTTDQIQKALINSALGFDDPEYNKVAGRLFLGEVRKSSVASLDFVDFYHQMVDDGFWREMRYDEDELELLASYIDHSKDEGYGYPQLRQLTDKYMLSDPNDVLLELPQYTYMGVAMSLMETDPIEDVIMYYQKASEHKLSIPSPILSTQRTPSNVGVSCVITTGGDTLHGIQSAKEVAFFATANSAGLGIEFDVRSEGDDVRNGFAKAGGKLPHYKVLGETVNEVTQKGRGGSATMTYNVLDPEIFMLLNLRLPRTVQEKRVDTLHYSLALNNSFLRRSAKRQKWCLVSKHKFPELHKAFYDNREEFDELMDYAIDNNMGKIVDAFEVLTKYLTVRQETGKYYAFNVDNVNDHTPFNETVRLSNLCHEICLPTRPYNHNKELQEELTDESGLTAQCFLSALDVARIEDDKDYEECAYIALKSLDNLMETMDYPFPQFESSAKKYRSVGVGVTNLAYCIAKNETTYSDVNFIHEIAERHYWFLLMGSIRLANERGKFELIDKTKWADGWTPLKTYNKNVDTLGNFEYNYDWNKAESLIKEYGVRFSTLCTNMPCESSSIACGATNGWYPIRHRLVVKDSRHGKIPFYAPDVDVLNYEYAYDMPYKTLIDSYAIGQKWNDQSTSADTYLDFSKYPNKKVPVSESVKNFLYTMKMGVKTLYYQNFRTGRGEKEIEKDEGCEGCTV